MHLMIQIYSDLAVLAQTMGVYSDLAVLTQTMGVWQLQGGRKYKQLHYVPYPSRHGAGKLCRSRKKDGS